MKQRGFTLIELVVVIVILGILAATALPKFIDLSSDAETAAVNGVAGSIASASSINYGAFKISPAKAVGLSGTNVCDNTTLGNLLEGGVPSGYTISGTGNCSTNTTVTCTVTKGNATVSATVVCAK